MSSIINQLEESIDKAQKRNAELNAYIDKNKNDISDLKRGIVALELFLESNTNESYVNSIAIRAWQEEIKKQMQPEEPKGENYMYEFPDPSIIKTNSPTYSIPPNIS